MSWSHGLMKLTVWQGREISNLLQIKDHRIQKKKPRCVRSLGGAPERRSHLNYCFEVPMGLRQMEMLLTQRNTHSYAREGKGRSTVSEKEIHNAYGKG